MSSLDKVMKEVEEIGDFRLATLYAVVLGFPEDKPLALDLTIPCPQDLSVFVFRAMAEICGYSEEFQRDFHYGLNLDKLENPDNLGKRVRKGLDETFCYHRDMDSAADNFMSWIKDTFGDEFVYGKGTLYRLRKGVRPELEERVRKYWNASEMNDFEKLNVIVLRLARQYYDSK